MTDPRLCAACQKPLPYDGKGRPPVTHPGECRRIHSNRRDEARRGQRFAAYLEKMRADRRRAAVTANFAGAEHLPDVEPGTPDPLGAVGYSRVDETIVPENLPKDRYLVTRRAYLAAESRERAFAADEAAYREHVAEKAAAWPCMSCPLVSATATVRRARARWQDAMADEYADDDLRARLNEVPQTMRRRPA